MKSWWESIFGGTNVINGGMDLINNAFYTDQERADRKVLLLDAFTPFKLIQRFLAAWIVSVFMILLLLEVVLVVISIWFPSVLEAVAIINSLVMIEMLGWGFVAVVSLYFTGGVINTFMGAKK